MARTEPVQAAAATETSGAVGLADDRLARASVVTLRVVMAFLWIQNTRWKIPPDFGADRKDGLYRYVEDAVKYPVLPPYSWLAEHVLLPNLGLFGWAVLAAEATIGACLLVGFMTRLVGLLGVAQAFAIFLSVGQTPGEWPWSYYLMMVGCLAIAGLAAGRVAGLDGVLRPRLLQSGGLLRRAAVFS
ncbi:MAG: DoxX family protein [Kineosporiaceae bacterium]|jgi:thiosulfate dehydrogenase [quinone] large subunit